MAAVREIYPLLNCSSLWGDPVARVVANSSVWEHERRADEVAQPQRARAAVRGGAGAA
jgi:hypothetical protein